LTIGELNNKVIYRTKLDIFCKPFAKKGRLIVPITYTISALSEKDAVKVFLLSKIIRLLSCSMEKEADKLK
jgi:CRISPR/Cas system CMR-associated protein Cmr1 (group 7 of RAMP superfamily)